MYGANTLSRRQDVLVNHTTEPIATQDTSLGPLRRRHERRTSRVRRIEVQCSMRSVAIVVVREDGENLLKVLLVEDQQPVETLRPNGAYEPLRHAVRLWGPKRRANDLEPGGSKHLVKAVGEFLVPVLCENSAHAATRPRGNRT